MVSENVQTALYYFRKIATTFIKNQVNNHVEALDAVVKQQQSFKLGFHRISSLNIHFEIKVFSLAQILSLNQHNIE